MTEPTTTLQPAGSTAHRCDRRHRSTQTLAECRWPEAAWIVGSGPYAVLAHCDMLSVSLYDTSAEALAALAQVDARRCCRDCTGQHELVVLSLD